MSSSRAAKSKEGAATTVVGATGVGSKADGAGIEVMTGSSGKFGSLITGGGERDGRASTKYMSSTRKRKQGEKSTGKGNAYLPKSRQNRQMEAPSSSAQPRGATAAAAASKGKNLANPPGRRFAEYTLASLDRPHNPAGGSRGGGWGRTGHGKDWLWDYLKEPRRPGLEQVVYYEDELCVVIYDGFPKSQYHLLLIGKGTSVTRLTDLRRKHLPSKRRLHDTAKAIAEELRRQGAGQVRCGYHAIPSVEPLHIHIVSQDFDSPDLFKKSHWNGFTTECFLDCPWVETQLQERERLVLDKKKYTRLPKKPVQCFRCGWTASVESLKKHHLDCAAPLP